MKRTCVKIVAVRENPDTPCWPCINHDADKELARVTAPVIQNNPDIDFDIVSYTELSQAKADYDEDVKKYDGVLVLLLTCWKGIDLFYAQQSRDGIPTIIADVPFCGSGSMLWNTVSTVRDNDLPVPVLSTLDYNEIAEAVRIFDVLAKMRRTTVLVVQDVPETGHGNRAELSKRFGETWGIRVVTAGSEEFLNYMKAVPDDEAQKVADHWVADSVEVREPTRDDLLESARVYVSVRNMMRDYGAQAVTLDCLGLSYTGAYGEHRHFYPCLSHFEMLNNGVVAVCEADLNSTVTELLIHYLTGRPGFVSDPVIDTSSDQIIYAHCVACRKVFGCNDARSCRYIIRSHAEDKKGASVQVIFPAGEDVTTVIVYPDFACIHSAKSVGNVGLEEGCRSKLAAVTDAQKVLYNWRGAWHRVTVFGDYRKAFMWLFKSRGLKVYEEDR